MILVDFTLIVITVLCVVIGIILKILNKNRKLFITVHVIPLAGAIFHFICLNVNMFLIVVYFAALLWFCCLFLQRKKILYSIFTALVLLLAIGIGCIPKMMDSKCYASLSYEKAFERLNADMSRRYALADYKNIDFEVLYDKYQPIICEAEKNRDKTAYLNALVDYTNEFHDGHISVYDMLEFFGVGSLEDLSNAKKERFCSCYQMSLLKLDSGEYVAVHVLANGPAFQAGIREGDIILKWNGKPVAEQVAALTKLVPVRTWMYADKDNVERYAPFFLACMSEDEVEVTYLDADGKENCKTMRSDGNGYWYLRETIGMFADRVNGGSLQSSEKENVTFRAEKDYFYMNINGFGCTKEQMKQELDTAYSALVRSGADKILLDVRNNTGGDDELGAMTVGYFAKHDMLYLKESTFDTESRTYTVNREITVKAQNKIDMQVVLLVNSQCISAGEGFAYNMAKLDNVTVTGITGTNGSFGTFSGINIMPENVIVVFPNIACLDEDNQIMIDSGTDGIGGVKPKIKIPVDETAAKVIFQTDRDYELEYAEKLLK